MFHQNMGSAYAAYPASPPLSPLSPGSPLLRLLDNGSPLTPTDEFFQSLFGKQEPRPQGSPSLSPFFSSSSSSSPSPSPPPPPPPPPPHDFDRSFIRYFADSSSFETDFKKDHENLNLNKDAIERLIGVMEGYIIYIQQYPHDVPRSLNAENIKSNIRHCIDVVKGAYQKNPQKLVSRFTAAIGGTPDGSSRYNRSLTKSKRRTIRSRKYKMKMNKTKKIRKIRKIRRIRNTKMK